MVKTFGLVALAAVAALVLGFGSSLGSSSAPKASADTTGVSVVGCELLLTVAPTACTANGITPAVVTTIANNVGNKDGILTQSDLASIDALDGNQLSASCTAAAIGCTLDIFVFVNNHGTVTLDNPSGLINLQNNGEDFICNLQGAVPQDDDCNATPDPSLGDGVVVFQDINGTATAGSVKTVTVTQGTVSQNFDVNVVGGANNIALTLVEKTIGTSKSVAVMNTCQTTQDVADPTTVSNPNSTLLFAQAMDATDTLLTRVLLTEAISPASAQNTIVGLAGTPAVSTLVNNTVFTVKPSTAGAPIGQYQVVCGGPSTGTATITATLAANAATGATADTATATITVVGAPANAALTAAPTEIKCDGTQTSTVTAKVTDSAGNNVADGTPVSFSVVALGTANPINTTTTGGTASTTVTPLSNSSAGVTVIVTAGDATTGQVQSSILVGCTTPLVTQPTAAPAAPSPTPSTGITGPNTGTGGYLGQNSDSGFPMWTLIVLALGSLTLVAGGAVARRAGK